MQSCFYFCWLDLREDSVFIFSLSVFLRLYKHHQMKLSVAIYPGIVIHFLDSPCILKARSGEISPPPRLLSMGPTYYLHIHWGISSIWTLGIGQHCIQCKTRPFLCHISWHGSFSSWILVKCMKKNWDNISIYNMTINKIYSFTCILYRII